MIIKPHKRLILSCMECLAWPLDVLVLLDSQRFLRNAWPVQTCFQHRVENNCMPHWGTAWPHCGNRPLKQSFLGCMKCLTWPGHSGNTDPGHTGLQLSEYILGCMECLSIQGSLVYPIILL